ncbi:MAG: GNAT family N-acetyltransferase [Rhizobiaceae bacterium]
MSVTGARRTRPPGLHKLENDWVRDAPQPGRAQFLSVQQETLGSSTFTLELSPMSLEGLESHGLSDLLKRAPGINPFFGPQFLQATFGRLHTARDLLMILKEQVGDDVTTRLALPLSSVRTGVPPIRVLSAASHPFAPLSTPLVSADDAESLDRFGALLARSGLLDSKALLFEDFPADSWTASEFLKALQRNGFHVHLQKGAQRAALTQAAAASANSSSNSKRRREIQRQLRKLSGLGEVTFETATSYWDVLVRFEEFLLLETRSWKGRKGTSIHVIRKTAAFARQAVSSFALGNMASIHTVRLDGRAIASLIVLRSGNSYYPWKTAFDEHYNSFAPGIQLMNHATGWLLAQPGFRYADSLAAENGWMDKLWSDRTQLYTAFISRDRDVAEQVAVAHERRHWMKQQAKSGIARSKKLVRSLLPR